MLSFSWISEVYPSDLDLRANHRYASCLQMQLDPVSEGYASRQPFKEKAPQGVMKHAFKEIDYSETHHSSDLIISSHWVDLLNQSSMCWL
jgi:hypothetical protein